EVSAHHSATASSTPGSVSMMTGIATSVSVPRRRSRRIGDSRTLKPSEVRQRPDDDEGAPNDQVLGDRAEESAVLRVVTVVAHDDDLIVADLLSREGAGSVPLLDVRLNERPPVDQRLAVAHFDGLPRSRVR